MSITEAGSTLQNAAHGASVADDLRSVLRWESGRMGAISAGVLRQVIARLDSAPVAIMDTRDALGICAPTEEEFPAIYELQGKRVRLVLEDVTHNVEAQARAEAGEARCSESPGA